MCSWFFENIIWSMLLIGGLGCLGCLLFGAYCIINKLIFDINEKNNARMNFFARSIGYVFPYFVGVVILGAIGWFIYLPFCGF